MAPIFEHPVRVYYEDTDAGGIVYYANYLKFMERARTEWLRSLGIEQDVLLEQGVAFVVRHIDIDFVSAARFNAQLVVKTELKQLRRASLIFEQQIADQSGRLIAQAKVTIACVRIDVMKPMAIPSDITGVICGATS